MITHNILVDSLIRDESFRCGKDCPVGISCEKCCNNMVTEYEESIRSEAVHKFVERLVEKGAFQSAKIKTTDGREFDNYGWFWLSEYEKERKNEN